MLRVLRTSSSLSSRWMQHRANDFSDLTGLYFSRSQSFFILILESTSGIVPYRVYLLTYDLLWRVSSLLLSCKILRVRSLDALSRSFNISPSEKVRQRCNNWIQTWIIRRNSCFWTFNWFIIYPRWKYISPNFMDTWKKESCFTAAQKLNDFLQLS